MYGILTNIDLSFFVNKALIQICFGAHDLILNFDENISITVTSCIGCKDSEGIDHKYVNFKEAANILVTWLNQIITSAEREDKETLTLKFQDGASLKIYDDSKEYESFTIRGPNGLTVV